MVTAIFTKLKSFALECRRVLTVTKKPTREEITNIIKVTGIGIALIGVIGFVLNMVNRIIFP